MTKEEILNILNGPYSSQRMFQITVIYRYCLLKGKPDNLINLFIQMLLLNVGLLDYCFKTAYRYFVETFEIVSVIKNNELIMHY